MTHTVILDETDRDRVKENHKNEIVRHCRIGRVTMLPFAPAFDFKPAEGFFARLSYAQQAQALSYQGPENHGPVA